MSAPKSYKRFDIYFKPHDWDKIKSNAEKANMNVSMYIRETALKGNIKIYDYKAIDKLYRELNSIGKNINQIARVANESKSVYESDLLALQDNYQMLKNYTERQICDFTEDNI